MSNFFLKAYMDKVREGNFIPEDKADFEVLIQTFLLENALRHLNTELNQQPEKALIPLRIIRSVMEPRGVLSEASEMA
jgi:maltose alpha-D-glucosyltransferase/alpha-amylase